MAEDTQDKQQFTYLDKERKIRCWLVGYNFGGTDNQKDRFFKENIWVGREKNNKDNIPIEKCIKKGDILVLKSTATKGTRHNITFMRIIGIGRVESECLENEDKFHHEFKVNYINKEEKRTLTEDNTPEENSGLQCAQ